MDSSEKVLTASSSGTAFQGALPSQFGYHLPKFTSFMNSPYRRTCGHRSTLPFSAVDLSMNGHAPRPPTPSSTTSRLLESPSVMRASRPHLPSEAPSQGFTSRVPPQPSESNIASQSSALLASDVFYFHEAIQGFPALQRRVKAMLERARAEEQRTLDQPPLRPEEVLRCRYLRLSENNIATLLQLGLAAPQCLTDRVTKQYLRLSENNIATLLQLCKKNGIQVGIHPHMKESEIDVSTVFRRPVESPCIDHSVE
ncbi:UNVERIFIED_CONTAM: hypothetical protein FKN15_061296 [Acipenser sinensis]